MNKRLFISVLAIVLTLAAMLPAYAGDLVVTRYFSGLWDQTHEESQGIVLHVVDQEDDEGNPKAVAYWFTYGDDLQTEWYMAIGHVEGDMVLMELYTAYDVGFMEPDSVSVNPVEAVGSLDLKFKNCNKGTASYSIDATAEKPARADEFDIRRLAGLYNGRCTGGISDNTPKGGKPLMLEVKLLPVDENSDAEGKAKYWERPDRIDFHVSAEGLADGAYTIHVCGENVGPLTVFEGEGATQFRSPESEGKLNLTFKTKDCPIDIREGAVVLTSGDDVLSEKEKGPNNGEDGDGSEVEVEFVNTGEQPDARGDAEYEVEGDESEFSVTTRGLAAGDYAVLVDGSQWGILTVINPNAKSKLEIEDPESPLGAVVEIVSDAGAGVVVLWAQFPDEFP